MQPEVKTCSTCKQEKDLSSFWKKSEMKKDGSRSWRAICKECDIKKKLIKYYEGGGKELQQKRAFRALMRSYGITEEIYEQERIKQQYKCLLCEATEESQYHKRLFVDHCHETGKYRGLLCGLCNTGLGSFKDNVEVLQKAIEYINENSIRHRNNFST